MSQYVGEYPLVPDIDMMTDDDWEHLTECWRHEHLVIQALKYRPRINGGNIITKMIQRGQE